MPRVVCITNNAKWNEWAERICIEDFEILDAPPQAVFERARDLIHAGWKFLAHPQYGNFQPSKHPYRSLVLEAPQDGTANVLDMDSCTMLDAAMEHFRRPVKRLKIPESMLDDFAMLDTELMKVTVERYLKK